MNGLHDWEVESTTRLGKLTLIFTRNEEPRGSITFEEEEEEEAATWVDLLQKHKEASGSAP